MSFFDKFKAGVTDAGNKAKVLVEVNRLKLQNSGKKNEIDDQLREIGKIVYAAAEAGQWPLGQESIRSQMDNIRQLKFEIEQNQLQIANLTDEKVCRGCGNSSAINAKFCSHCGRTFEVIQVGEEKPSEDIRLLTESKDETEDPPK